MIDSPTLVSRSSFQEGWLEAAKHLSAHGWRAHNLVVSIEDTLKFDADFHAEACGFADRFGLLDPKHVAYTIFPHGLYRWFATADRLFRAYNRENGMYDRLSRRRRPGWGTYFRRMTHYVTCKGTVNQLSRVIQAIRSRNRTSKAAYTIVIPQPGGETVRPLGAPCLNYLAIQMEPETPPHLGVVCVFRNHDFVRRAYGNYWGLCNLLKFIACETGTRPDRLTCVSSHAYVDTCRRDFTRFLETLR
jgi:hypothetical protein